MTAGKAFADNLGCEAEVGRALSAAKVGYVTVQVLLRGSGVFGLVRGVR